MYRLIISPQAQRELKKIQKDYQPEVKLALEELREDPLLGKPLDRELTGRVSYRVGVYRIIYKVNQKDKIVNILSAGHRLTAYN